MKAAGRRGSMRMLMYGWRLHGPHKAFNGCGGVLCVARITYYRTSSHVPSSTGRGGIGRN